MLEGGNEQVTAAASEPAVGQQLRLLSWNIQAGVNSARYRHYLTQSWKHLLPHPGRVQTLEHIAATLGEFDLVGLQETDSGSLRTGFVNQTEYLAQRAGFPWWSDQTNRRLGSISNHANGLLSRLRPDRVEDHVLPGLPGRGVLSARFGEAGSALQVFILHLALGRRGRLRQLAFLCELLQGCRHAIVMGDMNCAPRSDELRMLVDSAGMHAPEPCPGTFPSWRPRRHIDHILVSASLAVECTYVPAWSFSDHLPIALTVRLPAHLHLDGRASRDS